MNTLSAFAMGRATKNNEQMVFDWDEAARRIVAVGARDASAGLRDDWEYTGGPILRDGEPVTRGEGEYYLGSTWAVPELDTGVGALPCYVLRSARPEWDAETSWPESALAILRAPREAKV